MIHIRTNHQARPVLRTDELPQSVIDWWQDLLGEKMEYMSWVHYRGEYYLLDEFQESPSQMSMWDGVHSETYFSGVCMRYPRDEWGGGDYDNVVMGSFYIDGQPDDNVTIIRTR